MHDSKLEKPLQKFGGGEKHECRQPEKVPSGPSGCDHTAEPRKSSECVSVSRRSVETPHCSAPSLASVCVCGVRACARPTPQDSGIKKQEVSCSVDKADRQLQDRKVPQGQTHTHTYPNQQPAQLKTQLKPDSDLNPKPSNNPSQSCGLGNKKSLH